MQIGLGSNQKRTEWDENPNQRQTERQIPNGKQKVFGKERLRRMKQKMEDKAFQWIRQENVPLE